MSVWRAAHIRLVLLAFLLFHSPGHAMLFDRCRRLATLIHTAKHRGVRAYALDATSLNYSPGHHVTVTLSGHQPFVGFVLRARFVTEPSHADQPPDGRLNSSVGEWVGDPSMSTTVTCAGAHDVVVHCNVIPKRRVSFTWTSRSAHTPVQFIATVFPDSLRHRTKTTSIALLPNSHVAILKRSEREVKDKNAGQQIGIATVDATSELPTTTSYEDTPELTVTNGEQGDGVTGNGRNYSHAIFYLCTIVAAYVGMLTVFSLLLV